MRGSPRYARRVWGYSESQQPPTLSVHCNGIEGEKPIPPKGERDSVGREGGRGGLKWEGID